MSPLNAASPQALLAVRPNKALVLSGVLTAFALGLLVGGADAADGMPEPTPKASGQQQVVDDDATYGVVVTPDRPISLRLSNRDMNRFHCENGSIEDFRFSSEKGITADARGDNFFVKFQIKQSGQHLSYVTQRSEFFVACGGEMFTIYAEPTNVASQTVFLRQGERKRSVAAAAAFAPLSHEERAVRLIKAALLEEFPDSYRVGMIEGSFVPGPLPGMLVRPYRTVGVDGLALRAAEYHVTANRPVVLDERMFLRPEFGASIYSVTIATEERALDQGGVARVIVTTIGEGGSL